MDLRVIEMTGRAEKGMVGASQTKDRDMTIHAQIETPTISGMTQIRERARLRLAAGRAFDAVAGYGVADSDLEAFAASQEIIDATKDLAAALTSFGGARFDADEGSALSHGMSMISVENRGGRREIDEISVADDDGAYIVVVRVIGFCRIEANVSSKRHAREIYVQGIIALAADLAA